MCFENVPFAERRIAQRGYSAFWPRQLCKYWLALEAGKYREAAVDAYFLQFMLRDHTAMACLPFGFGRQTVVHARPINMWWDSTDSGAGPRKNGHRSDSGRTSGKNGTAP